MPHAFRWPMAPWTRSRSASASATSSDPLEACREIARVLRPHGKLVILEFSLPRAAPCCAVSTVVFPAGAAADWAGDFEPSEAPTRTLPSRLRRFLSPDEFSHSFASAGFGTVRAVPLTFGVVYMFVAVKDGIRSAGCYNRLTH